MLMVTRLKLPIQPLVNQMLDQLPNTVWNRSDTTFLDPAMGGGQFLVEIQARLRAAGHSDENIAQRMYGCEENILRVNYSKNNKKLITNNLFVRNIFAYDWDGMKFDVIVGNPPYQDEQSNPLYYKVHNLCVHNLLKVGGYLAMVTPDAMAVGLETGTIKGCHELQRLELMIVNISSSIKTTYFPQIGINNFCWYVGKKSHNLSQSYQIVTDSGTMIGRLNPLKPVQLNPTINSILEKCFEHNRNPYSGNWTTVGSTAQTHAKGKTKAVTSIDDKNKLVSYNVNLKNPHRLDGHPKVFVSGFGNRAAVAYDHSMIAAVEKTVYTVPTPSDTASENLVQLLDCKLQKFLTVIIKARGPYVDFLRHFRGVDISRAWTDQQLYQHFGLTQEEIDLIETTAG